MAKPAIPRIVSAAVVVTGAILLVVALDEARALLAPVLSAIVLGVVLAPLVDGLERLGIPPAAGAFAVFALFVVAGGGIFFVVEPAISEAVARAPLLWDELDDIADALRRAFSGLQEMQDNMNEALDEDRPGETGAADSEAEGDEAVEGEVRIPSIFEALSWGPALAGALLIFAGTLYFFLAGRADLYRQMEGWGGLFDSATLRAAEARVSRYFLTITLINAGFGTAVTVAMLLLGVPYPQLWGLATFLLNFVLYLGPFTVSLGLLVVGIITFDGIMSVVPMAVFVGFNMIEAQFVTPTFVGRQMAMNPLLVFLSLVFWLWLWGPVGGLVAIPVIVWLRYVAGYDRDEPGSSGAAET